MPRFFKLYLLLSISFTPLAYSKEKKHEALLDDPFWRQLHDIEEFYKRDDKGSHTITHSYALLSTKNPDRAKLIADFWIKKSLHSNRSNFDKDVKQYGLSNPKLLSELMIRNLRFYLYDHWDEVADMVTKNNQVALRIVAEETKEKNKNTSFEEQEQLKLQDDN